MKSEAKAPALVTSALSQTLAGDGVNSSLANPIAGVPQNDDFALKIVAWQQSAGRHSLPWQNTRDPYRVWLSEIMLQQTQVVTVLDYYAQFLARYPEVGHLATAPLDDVLALWSGLGYYSRARHLHACARQVMTRFGGRFPTTAAQLETLPGIGPSTAAAVASFCFSERVAILDGNVKRVLTRYLAFEGDMSAGASVKQLWQRATALLPTNDLQHTMPRYTQGLMDLGATICTQRRPQCQLCPVQATCQARALKAIEKYPVKSKKINRSAHQLQLLWVRRADGSVWLERRPVTGIWGGLYCFPVTDGPDALSTLGQQLTHPCLSSWRLEPFLHVLTHKDLYLHTTVVEVSSEQSVLWSEALGASSHEAPSGSWFSQETWPGLGLPAPIRKLLASGGHFQGSASSSR